MKRTDIAPALSMMWLPNYQDYVALVLKMQAKNCVNFRSDKIADSSVATSMYITHYHLCGKWSGVTCSTYMYSLCSMYSFFRIKVQVLN